MPRAISPEKKAAIRERRLKVWRLRVVQKLTLEEIASAVGASHGTVENDLAVMRRARRDHLRRAQAAREAALQAAAEVVEECEAISRQAWTDLLAAPRGSATRARFLSVLLNAVQQRNEILQSLGMLEKAPEEIVLTAGSIRSITDQEATQMLMMLREKIAQQRALPADTREGRRER